LIEAGDARALDGPETIARLRAKLGDERSEVAGWITVAVRPPRPMS